MMLLPHDQQILLPPQSHYPDPCPQCCHHDTESRCARCRWCCSSAGQQDHRQPRQVQQRQLTVLDLPRQASDSAPGCASHQGRGFSCCLPGVRRLCQDGGLAETRTNHHTTSLPAPGKSEHAPLGPALQVHLVQALLHGPAGEVVAADDPEPHDAAHGALATSLAVASSPENVGTSLVRHVAQRADKPCRRITRPNASSWAASRTAQRQCTAMQTMPSS
mmetsp:Transcript_27140/g.49781  ORF Transcript_27140/g.49781 Transcript_27140/m.49781 type:complete len:219 (+) Transcript_27140:222-878(+)